MHDIGKNIVSVVLACNNYEIIDLGVMVPADRIIDVAKKKDVDVIGLSGLITPSLDEMVFLAREMERQQFQVPLLIGGATTSKAHTAVKIDPEYSASVVHVNDASRAVTVVGDLLNKEVSATYQHNIKSDYDLFRIKFLKRGKKKEYLSLEEARQNKFQIKWAPSSVAVPKKPGIHIIEDQDLSELIPFIDWTPFFRSWDLHGKFPGILEDKVVGEQARELYEDAQLMLDKLITGSKLRAKAIFGIFPANSDEDDIELQLDNGTAVFRTLRQQLKKRKGAPNLALADFIAPKQSGITDYVGCFCVTAGLGSHEIAREFEDKLDDYNAIMVKALADRLAEAYAEFLHQQLRREYWGYAVKEDLTNDQLIKEEYRGIRPAPGYPACPDHLEKLTIWDILDVENNIGVKLTETLAMWPAASVSGYYLAHPEAKYFGLGKIKEDQLRDYASRKGINLEEARKWLSPNLIENK